MSKKNFRFKIATRSKEGLIEEEERTIKLDKETDAAFNEVHRLALSRLQKDQRDERYEKDMLVVLTQMYVVLRDLLAFFIEYGKFRKRESGKENYLLLHQIFMKPYDLREIAAKVRRLVKDEVFLFNLESHLKNTHGFEPKLKRAIETALVDGKAMIASIKMDVEKLLACLGEQNRPAPAKPKS